MNVFLPYLVVCLFLTIIVLHGNTKQTYDERQIAARGKAFQYGFLTTVLCNIILGTAIVDVGNVLYGPTALLLSAFLGMTVFVVVAVFNDAFYMNKKQAVIYLICIGLTVLLNGLTVLITISKYGVNRLLSSNFMNLGLTATFLIIFIASVIKLILERGEEN